MHFSYLSVMNKEQLALLLRKFLSGTASDEEKKVLEKWYDDFGSELQVTVSGEKSEAELHDKMLRRLNEEINVLQPSRAVPLWKRLAVAASVLVILSAMAVYFFTKSDGRGVQVAVQTDIAPGTEHAVLIRSDGSRVVLGTDSNAAINEQQGVVIQNTGKQLSYAGAPANVVLYNTLEVPLKGVYSIILADGTKVWLNSVSSLYYPTAFPGKERRVKIKGEAYFEVSKNRNKPFIVEVDGKQEIEVLGTQFNVNAYSDEEFLKTTLLEGSIKIKADRSQKILLPGQEARYAVANKSLQLNKNADIDGAVSWKNGYFSAEGKDLKTILRQAMRWYDIEVEYRGDIQAETFAGEIPRNINLSELLKVLEITGVHFTLQGKKLTVLP